MKIRNLLILPLLLPLFGFVEILSVKEGTYKPKDPGTNLKSYQMKVYKKRFKKANEPLTLATYMTDLRIILNTTTTKAIRDYGVIQMIKGCKWESVWDGKELTKELNIRRDHMGQDIIFKHQDWEVDSDSFDPLYHSYDGDRFALWRWNKNPLDLNPETAKYLHFKETPHPTVFFTDLPGASAKYAGSKRAANSTLDFKTCIFHIQDLPQTTDHRGQNIDFTKALHCFEWKDHFEFDFISQTMKEPKEIDEVCR